MKLELIPVVRYWEIPARDYGALLEELQAGGARAVAVWVPWSQLETDHQHLLQKFLRAAFQACLPVRLGVSPEPGNGYWHSGIPLDLVADSANWAQDRLGETIYSCAPPNIQPLISLTAPTVFQRYGHFLLKLAQEVQEVLGDRLTSPVELVVTDSFFKHYANTGLASEDHGDYSSRYSKGDAPRAALHPAQAEQLFSQRAIDFLQSRFARFRQVKITYHAVCSRSASLDRLLEELAQSGPNLSGLIEAIQEKSATATLAWFDDLAGLSDRAYNFILSMSLVAFEECWCSLEDYQKLKANFRQRVARLVATYGESSAVRYQPVLALVGNRYAPAFFPRALQSHLGFSLKIALVNSDFSSAAANAQMLVVEEAQKLEYAQSKELLRLARAEGKTLIVFRSSLCDRANAEFAACRSFQLKHGWEFSVSLFPSGGQALVVEGSRITATEMRALAWNLLSVAKLEPWCNYKNETVASIRIDWQQSNILGQDSNGLREADDFNGSLPKANLEDNSFRSLFLFNTAAEEQAIQLEFSQTIRMGDGEGTELSATLPPLAALPLQIEIVKEISSEPAPMLAHSLQEGGHGA